MKTLVIFDLDGTLLNTISDLGEACNYALEKMGYPTHPISSYPFMVGNGVRRLLQRAFVDADDKTLAQLMTYFREYYDSHCTTHTAPYKGIPELLATLREKDVKMAVASNKYQEATSKLIGHYFPTIPFVAVCGQTDERSVKPDPSIVFHILGENPTPKRNVLYVGDSAVDMETAHRAGVESIGVTWGFRPVSELRSAAADHIASLPSDILKHLSDPF